MKNIHKLSSRFYEKYSHDKYKEILYDCESCRPYLVLCVLIDGVQYAIPFRTNPTKTYSYVLYSRKQQGREITSGLDFAKSLVIIDNSFIGEEAFIDSQEWKKLKSFEDKVVESFIAFIQKYKYITQNGVLNPDEDKLKKISSLQYFHKEMKILN